MIQARAGDKHGRQGVISFGGRLHARFFSRAKANAANSDDQSLVVRGERPPRQHLPRQLTFALWIQAAQQIVQVPGERLREHQRTLQRGRDPVLVDDGMVPVLVRLTR